MARPKIACIVLHRPGKLPGTLRTIADFAAQSYVESQLVISMNATLDASQHEHDVDRIVAYSTAFEVALRCTVTGPMTATPVDDASLYNLALDAAQGDFVTFWDARDRQHPNRLLVQYERLPHDAIGCALTSRLYYIWPARTLYWLDYTYGPATGFRGMVPDTLLCQATKQRILPGAINPLSTFMAAITGPDARGPVMPIVECAPLTIRTCVNAGTELRHALGERSLRSRVPQLDAELQDYDSLPLMKLQSCDGRKIKDYCFDCE
jgi:hypothetical protein